MKGRLGESSMSKYLGDLNPQKTAKVNESANNVKPSKYDRPEKQPPKKAAPAAKGPAKKAAPKKQQEEEKKPSKQQEEEKMEIDSEPVMENKQKSNNFDDMPIGGGRKMNMEDERPLGGGSGPKGFDEQPLGGSNKGGYNLDMLDDPNAEAMMMNFNNDKPKKKPPPRLAQKKKEQDENVNETNAKEEVGGGDVVMSPSKDDSAKAKPPQPKPKPKEAPAKTAPAKTSAPAAKGKDSGVQIQEEDLGAGLSKEEAEAKVREVFSAESVSKLEESKWQDKVEGFKLVGEQIVELQPTQDVIEGLVKFVKSKMKDWKESNINIIKEAIALFTVVAANCEKINKRAVSCIMPFLSEKIGDVKVSTPTQELLLSLAETVTPKFIALQVIKYASQAKAPKVLQESCNVLNTLTEDFGIVQMPIKEMIGYGTVALNHQNPQVRTSSMVMFASLYKQGGEMIKNFLTDVKESTMKLLEEEFAKQTILKKGEFKAKRLVKGAKEEQQIAGPGGKKKDGGGGGGLDDLLPREDISKQLNAKLFEKFKHNDWKVRKEAAEKIEEILRGAKMRIQPVGLNELMDNMKQRMADPNKSVLKSYIQLLSVLVEAIGPAMKQFSKKLLTPLLQNLSDKQSLVRNDVVACADKWGEQVGPETVINFLGPLIIPENPELRTEALTWIIKNNDAIKQAEVKDLVKPLVICLSDKVPNIRNMTEQVMESVMPVTGYAAFQAILKDLKPAVQNAIKPILEKVKNKTGAGTSGQDANNASLGQQLNASAQQQQQMQQQQRPQTAVTVTAATAGPAHHKEEAKDQNNSSLRSSQPKLKVGQGSTTTTNAQVVKEDSKPKSTFAEAAVVKQKQQSTTQLQPPKLQQRSDSKDPGKKGGLSESLRNSAAHQQDQQQQETLQINFGHKEKRAEHEKRNKWQTEEVKGDQVEKLRVALTQSVGSQICTKMFSNDFKQHMECLNLFQGVIDKSPENLTEILDLIFKWSQVKMAECSNTQFMLKLFDFYAILFNTLKEMNYQLWDNEAAVILPLLCDKAGFGNNIIKDKSKLLIRMVYDIYEVKKCYSGLIQYGLNSKNMKSQAECLNELEEFIKVYGVEYTSEKDLKLVAKLADSSDKGIRENAVTVMGEVFKLLDNDIWRILGEVTPKVQGLLEQRFKKIKGVGGGLGSSASTANMFQGHSQQHEPIGAQQDRSSPRGSRPQTSNIGFKRTTTNNKIDSAKQTITPRNQLIQPKSDKPPATGLAQQQNQSQMNQSAVNLSKSINSFSQQRNSEEQKQALNQTSLPGSGQNSQKATFSSKQSQLKKFSSQDCSGDIGGLTKKIMPQTQRVDSVQSEFTQIKKGAQEMEQQPQNFQPQPPLQFGKGFKSQVNNVEEDQDVKLLLNDEIMQDEIKGTGNIELDKQIDEILKHIQQLKNGDLSKRVDSLVSLNELISQIEVNKQALVRTANDLTNAFTHVLIDIFERPVEEIPLRFAKYFITIVLKACSCKEIMREASEESIFELSEQLLTRLLIEGLDKVGENKEGELILKNLNSSMLRLLENCNHTYIFCVLFNLLRKYKDFHKLPKLPGLIIKCLLKLSKILEKLIDKLDMEKILLAIHEYLVVVDHDNKTQNDEMGIRIVKTVTNELVKLKRESIWESYKIIQQHSQQDNHIYRWIQIILKSLQNQGGATANGQSSTQSTVGGGAGNSSNQEQEIKMIIEELRNSEMFDQAVPKLYKFLERNPEANLNDYLQDCSKTFQEFIRKNLDKYKSSIKEESKTGDDGMMSSIKSTNHSDNSKGAIDYDNKSGSMSTSNRVIEYQSKLSSIKQRYNQKGGQETSTNREQVVQQEENYAQPQFVPSKSTQVTQQQPQQQQPSQQTLNTSFSDMNNRLTQKWNQINKKTSAQKDSMGHMSNTMGGFGGPQGLEKPSMNLNSSSGAGLMEGDQNMQGASNSDLNKRLAEMKAKLQALKKK